MTSNGQLLTLLGTDLKRGQSAALEEISGNSYISVIKQTKESSRYFLNVSADADYTFEVSVEAYVEVVAGTPEAVVIGKTDGIRVMTPNDSFCVVTAS